MPWTNEAFEDTVAERAERLDRAIAENLAIERIRIRRRLLDADRRLAEDRKAAAEVKEKLNAPD